MTDKDEFSTSFTGVPLQRAPRRLEESAAQARAYTAARVVSLAMPLEGHDGGRVAQYKLDPVDAPLQPLCFSFDEPHTGTLLTALRIGTKANPENVWLDAFHSSNFPKWGPTGVRTYFGVVEPGVILRALVTLPGPMLYDWQKWQLTCWAVMLER